MDELLKEIKFHILGAEMLKFKNSNKILLQFYLKSTTILINF